MIINDLDGYYIVFDTKNWNTELDTLIVCGKEVGTAFYVAPDLLLTAYHTVACYSDDAENIVKDSTDGDLHFEVIRNIEEFDISILKVSARSEKDFYGLQAHHLRIDEDVESFGYPDKNSDGGLRLYGKINQKVYGKPANYQLCPKDISDLYDRVSSSLFLKTSWKHPC